MNQTTTIKNRALPLGKKHSVYLASPFFKPDQIERVELIEKLLEKHGYSYFSPRKELVCPPNSTEEVRKKTFEGNHNGILNSEMVKDWFTLLQKNEIFFNTEKEALYFLHFVEHLVITSLQDYIVNDWSKEELMKDFSYKKKWIINGIKKDRKSVV